MDNERSLSALDIPHRFVFAGNYEIPWFKNHSSEFVRAVLGGFELAGIFQAQSGQPWTPLSGIDSNQNFDSAPDRAIVNPGVRPGPAAGFVLSMQPGSYFEPELFSVQVRQQIPMAAPLHSLPVQLPRTAPPVLSRMSQ